MTSEPQPISPLRQPKAVFAVAFACVGPFTGIGAKRTPIEPFDAEAELLLRSRAGEVRA